MSKVKLKNMDFCPPRKWRVYEISTGRLVVKNTIYIECYRDRDDKGIPIYALCGFTGYCDSKGEEVYGGHVRHWRWHKQDYYYVVRWLFDAWYIEWLTDMPELPLQGMGFSSIIQDRCSKTIGHIHQPDSWSEEVRGLLE